MEKNVKKPTSYKLQCDECQGLFNEKCIPRSHKDNIPDDKDGDNFLCHTCHKEDSDSYTSSISPDEDKDEPYEYNTEQTAKNIERRSWNRN
ncbi:hypothetical protein JTB14_003057 [Gonioctena quinquepunctata]|nr:hypothetical protein JTB14_003057 [Gonioctena quinquepunctata]